MITVVPATQVIQPDWPVTARVSMPKIMTAIFTRQKTPVLTTATACSSALTGVGATIAAGSQKCSGISAALPTPNRIISTSRLNMAGLALPARMPPGVKSKVPASTQMPMIAGRNNTKEEPSSISR